MKRFDATILFFSLVCTQTGHVKERSKQQLLLGLSSRTSDVGNAKLTGQVLDSNSSDDRLSRLKRKLIRALAHAPRLKFFRGTSHFHCQVLCNYCFLFFVVECTFDKLDRNAVGTEEDKNRRTGNGQRESAGKVDR